MKFFMYSKCGEGAGLLKRIQDEGNEVRLYIKEQDYQSIYNGIIEKSSGPVDKDEIIIFDSSGSGRKADSFRRAGYRVFGASKFADDLENDREFGLNFMKSHNIQTPVSEEFFKLSDGINYIKNNSDSRYVFKPSGDLPSKLTYCSSDCEDLLSYLKYIEKFYARDIDSFVLQEFIEGSVVSTEVWCGKNGFIHNLDNHTVETKKLMNDDLGPSTGCSGNLIWLIDDSDVIIDLLLSIEKDLIKEGYIGPIDLNCIVSNGKPYGLEWTPRFGLDAMPTMLQLFKTDISKLIFDMVEGNKSEPELHDMFAAGVRITIPPYPIELKDTKIIQKISPNQGIPIRDLDYDNTYFYEVERGHGDLFHSEGTGVIAVVSDYDSDIESCLNRPYEILEDCKVPDKQYRTDLREVLVQMHSDIAEEIKNADVRA